MKLNKEIKKRIDEFFANITAEELYEMSIRKYGFVEDTSIDITGEYESIGVELCTSPFDESYDNEDVPSNFVLAA